MGISYQIAKRTYRLIASDSLARVLFGGHSRFSRMILAAKAQLEARATHNEVYDENYFRLVEEEMVTSAHALAESIKERMNPSSVIDVGCGPGSVMAALRKRGIPSIGLEYADAAIRMCHAKGLDVRKFDLESEVAFDEKAPLVISTEVAEHLPASCAERYVDLLCRASTYAVVITAAVPGQGGTDHVNEQPNEYWIEKFVRRGFEHFPERTEDWREDWRNRGVDCFRSSNVMVFTRK